MLRLRGEGDVGLSSNYMREEALCDLAHAPPLHWNYVVLFKRQVHAGDSVDRM